MSTYEMSRYFVSRSGLRAFQPDAMVTDEIVVVTLSDAQIAVEAAWDEAAILAQGPLQQAREQAIKDCIQTAEVSKFLGGNVDDTIAALCALLTEGSEK